MKPPRPSRRADAHIPWRCAVLLLPLALAAACAGYVPFDGSLALASEFERRLGAEWQREVTVPFAIDEELRQAVDDRISPAGSEARRRDAVLDFIFGWLDLEYALTPTHTATETFGTATGNCLSFVNLFVAVGRERRLNPFFVEVEDYQRWNYQDGVVVSRGHIVAGMYVDGDMATYDFLPYRPKSYRDFRPITDLAATGHYYNNLGAEALMNGDLDAAERWLEIAVRLTPDFDKAINNHAIVALRLRLSGRRGAGGRRHRHGARLHAAGPARRFRDSGGSCRTGPGLPGDGSDGRGHPSRRTRAEAGRDARRGAEIRGADRTRGAVKPGQMGPPTASLAGNDAPGQDI